MDHDYDPPLEGVMKVLCRFFADVGVVCIIVYNFIIREM